MLWMWCTKTSVKYLIKLTISFLLNKQNNVGWIVPLAGGVLVFEQPYPVPGSKSMLTWREISQGSLLDPVFFDIDIIYYIFNNTEDIIKIVLDL